MQAAKLNHLAKRAAERYAISAAKQWIIDYTNRYAVVDWVEVAEEFTDGVATNAMSELCLEGAMEYAGSGDTRPHPNVYRRKPRVGDHATLQIGSDSRVYNILDVWPSGKRFTIDRPDCGTVYTIAQRAKDGTWRTPGGMARGQLVYPGLDKPHLDRSF